MENNADLDKPSFSRSENEKMIRARSRQLRGRIREEAHTTLSKNFAVQGQLLEGAVSP